MVGSREVAGDPEPLLKVLVRVELGTVVEGDGLKKVRFCSDDSPNGGVGLSSCPVKDFCYPGQASLTLNQSDDTLELVGAHHGVAFPMTELRSIVAAGWSVTDTEFSLESASVILALVTFSASFGYDSEIFEQFTTAAAILFDPTVDGGNADRDLSVELQTMTDLLRAPLKLEELIHLVPLVRGKVATAVATVISSHGVGVGNEGRVSTRGAAITLLLTVERAWMSAKFLCDLRNRIALGQIGRQGISFLLGELRVLLQSMNPFLAGNRFI